MKTIITLLVCTLPIISIAQVTIKSLTEAIEITKTNNKDLLVATEKALIESENSRIISSAFIPQIKAISTLDYNYALPVQLIPAEFLGGKEGDYRRIQFGTRFNYSGGIEAVMPLINTSLLQDFVIAKTTIDAANYSKENLTHEISKQVVKGYYLSLLTKRSIEISKVNLANADTLLHIASKKLGEGIIEPLEYNRVQTNRNQAHNDLIQNEAIHKNNLNTLKYFLGLNQEEQLILTEEPENIPETIFVNEAGTVPSLLEKQTQLKAATIAVRKEKLKRLPELSIYARYFRQAQRNEFNFLESNQPWFDLGATGVRLELPLFTGYTRFGNIKKSKLKLKIQQLEVEKEHERVALENKELNNNLLSNIHSALNLKNSFELNIENQKIGLLKYKEGLYNLDQYLLLENQSLSIQNQYLKALTEAYINRSIIDLKNSL